MEVAKLNSKGVMPFMHLIEQGVALEIENLVGSHPNNPLIGDGFNVYGLYDEEELIAQGALVAEELGLPYCYVRPKPKDHGMGNQVEGEIKQGAKVVVVEDLISTGGSSLKAVEALRQYGVEVVGMVASFTYGFPVAEEAFREAGVELITLSNYEAVIEEAAKTGYIKEEDKAVLAEWRKSPETWNPSPLS